MKTIKQNAFAGRMMLIVLLGLASACEKDEASDFPEMKIEISREKFWVSDAFQMELTFDGRKDERVPVTWSVSDESKAEVNQEGEIWLKKEGQVKIIASSGDESANYTIDIQPMHLLYQTTGRVSNAIESIDWSDGKTKTLLEDTWHFSAPRMAPDLSALVYADTLHEYDADILSIHSDRQTGKPLRIMISGMTKLYGVMIQNGFYSEVSGMKGWGASTRLP